MQTNPNDETIAGTIVLVVAPTHKAFQDWCDENNISPLSVRNLRSAVQVGLYHPKSVVDVVYVGTFSNNPQWAAIACAIYQRLGPDWIPIPWRPTIQHLVERDF